MFDIERDFTPHTRSVSPHGILIRKLAYPEDSDFRGELDADMVHPRKVFAPTVKDSGGVILFLYNYPSRDPAPK